MNDENLCSIINNIKSTYNSIDEERNRLLKEKEKLILNLENQYQCKIKSLDSKQSDINETIKKYKQILQTYSTFDIDSIGEIIAFIISSVENEEYIFQEIIAFIISSVENEEYIFQRAIHATYLWHNYVGYDGEYEKNNNKICIIIKKGLRQDCYLDKNLMSNCIKKIMKQERVILLDESSSCYDNYKVTFYNSIINTNNNIDLSSFPYIKDFIDYVIQYRYENNLIKIDSRRLNYLAISFIEDRIEKKKQLIKNTDYTD